MSYIFKGQLCGYLCERCSEWLGNVTVRLYRVSQDRDVAALADAAPKDTFAFLNDSDVQAKASLLLAEGQTDSEGVFSIRLLEDYDGGPFEVDVYCEMVPRPRVSRHTHPLQISLTTLQPDWDRTKEPATATAVATSSSLTRRMSSRRPRSLSSISS